MFFDLVGYSVALGALIALSIAALTMLSPPKVAFITACLLFILFVVMTSMSAVGGYTIVVMAPTALAIIALGSVGSLIGACIGKALRNKISQKDR